MSFGSVFIAMEESMSDQLIDQALVEIPGYRKLPLTKQQLAQRVLITVHAFGMDLDEEEPHFYRTHLEEGAYQRAMQGLPIDDFEQLVLLWHRRGIEMLMAKFEQPSEHVALLHQALKVIQSGLAGLYRGYDRARIGQLDRQQAILSELALPIIPVYKHILAVPLIGVIDSSRAQQMIERLLDEITMLKAQMVILDLTGVPLIDTGVAHHLLKTVHSARLLGARVIIVGIRGEIAQTMVHLGIDLSEITTRANLQAGVEYALACTGFAIRPL